MFCKTAWHFGSKERLGTTYVPRHGVHQWSSCLIRTRVKNIAVFLHNYTFPRLVIVQSALMNCSVLPSTWKPVYWNWLTPLLFVLFTWSCYSDWNATVTLYLEVTWRAVLSRVAPCSQDTQNKSVETLTQITEKVLYISSLLRTWSFLSMDGFYGQYGDV